MDNYQLGMFRIILKNKIDKFIHRLKTQKLPSLRTCSAISQAFRTQFLAYSNLFILEYAKF